jgi:hypothetical protein
MRVVCGWDTPELQRMNPIILVIYNGSTGEPEQVIDFSRFTDDELMRLMEGEDLASVMREARL